MSTPDYPLLTVPGYELYQLAHLTTFVVDTSTGSGRSRFPPYIAATASATCGTGSGHGCGTTDIKLQSAARTRGRRRTQSRRMIMQNARSKTGTPRRASQKLTN